MTSDMTDILIIFGIIFTIICLALFLPTVFGESREECVALNNTQAILIIENVGGIGEFGNCNWIVNDIIIKDEYKLNGYTTEPSGIENLWLFLKDLTK